MPSLPPSPHVTCRVEEGVATVALARPDKLNALTLEMLDALVATGRALRRDGAVRAVVLHGEGEAFCAGLDLRGALARPAAIATRFVPRPWLGTNVFQEACWVWRRLPVPVVAAVHGHCLGAGLQLALAADARVTAPDASWSVRETRWGLVPDMTGVVTLRELVGPDVATELTLTARTLGGQEATDLRLATGVADDPLAGAKELARSLSVADPRAVARAKALLRPAGGLAVRSTLARERRAQLGLVARMKDQDLPGRGSAGPGVRSGGAGRRES